MNNCKYTKNSEGEILCIKKDSYTLTLDCLRDTLRLVLDHVGNRAVNIL